jgi:predicted aldo/keto reductase-like oxidoreductase
MSHDASVSRRHFLRAGAAAAASAAAMPALASEQAAGVDKEKEEEPWVLPQRKLGKTGVNVSILGQGAAFAITTRHLNVLHSLGVRYIDTAKAYLRGGSERALAKWFNGNGHRKDYFVVTKDEVRDPKRWMSQVDERLETLETDYVDAFFLHGLGDSDFFGLEDAREILASREWAKAADAIRSSGKCRFFGFSSHTTPIEVRSGVLEAAAGGSWVDAILVAADPITIRDNRQFNNALDACHKAGVGLISMKECRTKGEGMERIFPTFSEKGLTPFTAVLTAMWTDERFSVVCSHMDNLEKLRENAAAAKNFKPLTDKEITDVHAMIEGSKRRFCLACDGSCRRAAGTKADLNRIARYVHYAEADGRVYEARELLAAMALEDRDWSGADLKAAAGACKSGLDFVSIIKRAEELMA